MQPSAHKQCVVVLIFLPIVKIMNKREKFNTSEDSYRDTCKHQGNQYFYTQNIRSTALKGALKGALQKFVCFYFVFQVSMNK